MASLIPLRFQPPETILGILLQFMDVALLMPIDKIKVVVLQFIFETVFMHLGNVFGWLSLRFLSVC